MNRQQQIDDFLLEMHRLAVARLRAEPARIADVAALLARWRALNGETRSDAYRDEWNQLVALGVEAIEREACAPTEHAAALRNISPLSVLVTQQERGALLRAARRASP
ncbi:hypothetical protein [Ramlibacter sp.]|uniref:hypothetical protein n=1 Tax=Ramlibacter sp. TaxID=1917967 RepID=UPI0017A32114|nr:hypothetical protein [Ramlibacter sp.]MBA2673172.1 hypothetical protein [Ramlibacter sp.]